MNIVVAVIRCAIVLLFALTLGMGCPVFADEAAASNAWQKSVALGLNTTRGNSETLNATVNLLAEKKVEGGSSWRLGVDAAYGEDSTTTTIENAKGFVGYKQDITRRTFGLLDTSAEHDSIAEVEYRLIVSPGLGYYFVRAEQSSLSVEFGPAFIREKIDDTIDDRFALRFAEKFEYKTGDSTKCWQSVEYLPGATDFANYLINAEVGAEAAINARLSLRLLWKDTYNSEPAEDREPNDLSFNGAVVCKF